MTRIGRKTACTVMFPFIAVGALLSATRFAASAPPDAAAQVTPPTQNGPSDSDPDDAKSAGHFSGRVPAPTASLSVVLGYSFCR